ncbi:aconitase family protein [Yinghuangia aomiensis]
MHVVGPQLGLTQPGMTVGLRRQPHLHARRFGALAFGIGTSQVEHVLATQTLPLAPFKTMAVTVNGELPAAVTAKDLILAVIAQIGTGGGQGYVIEYRGDAIRKLSMEGRMTVCNMSIEARRPRRHDRAGRDDASPTSRAATTAPQGADWDAAVEYWTSLKTDDDAELDRRGRHRRGPTWRRSSPGAPTRARCAAVRERAPAGVVRRPVRAPGRRKGPGVTWVSPPPAAARHQGRHRVRRLVHERPYGRPARGRRHPARPQGRRRRAHARSSPARCASRWKAVTEGLDKVFTEAGAEWRYAGCSMCLGMNLDQLAPGERSASTSNRNFEGRQGKGGRTHLVPPQVAAATAVLGRLAAPADLTAAGV